MLIDKRFSTRVERSPRVLEIAEAFGLGLDDKEFVVCDKLALDVRDGDVVYITGQSGAGKSTILREIARSLEAQGRRVANIDHVELLDMPIIDQIGVDMNDALRLLSIAGMNDANLYVRKPKELSDGQRYRCWTATRPR
jgi:ABC-type ATPase with predicted acetyltransferase domain